MKRAYRLRKPVQFQRVRRDGRSWSSTLLTLNAAASNRRGIRCGFVVGKRVGKAVERNRARRRVREAVRLIYDRITPGWDLVFIVRSTTVVTIEFPQIQSTVEQLLRRAGLWREPLTTADSNKG
ncbi:MAG: ribonuclease P protein component [Kouleothrix sp.]|nr:ribonuclease P protein component [Kouleothrix sp.]